MIAGRSTRMEILELLRRKHLSAEGISTELGITPNAVRQHLTNLERDGFVVSHPERGARGRPALLFSLTERADSVFPKRYGQLASMVLQELHRPAVAKQSQTTDPLSERELDVLRLIAQGMSNQDIASALVVGEATVRSHVSSILRKLQLASRTQAALYALRKGLVAPD